MTYQQDIERREKLQALSLAKECYTTKLELLTNASVVKDAIKFIEDNKTKDKKFKGGSTSGSFAQIISATTTEAESKIIVNDDEAVTPTPIIGATATTQDTEEIF